MGMEVQLSVVEHLLSKPITLIQSLEPEKGPWCPKGRIRQGTKAKKHEKIDFTIKEIKTNILLMVSMQIIMCIHYW